MNDRLGDLGGGTPSWAAEDDDDVNSGGGGGGGGWENEDSGGHDEEKGGGGGGGQPEHMEKFFRHVDFVKEDIDAVKEATKRIGEINEEAVLATTTSKESELSRILRPIVDETNKRAKRTKNLLALLKEENEKLKKEKDTKASDMRYVGHCHRGEGVVVATRIDKCGIGMCGGRHCPMIVSKWSAQRLAFATYFAIPPTTHVMTMVLPLSSSISTIAGFGKICATH